MRTRDTDDFFNPPHGGRPPSDEVVKEATERYVAQEAQGKLKDLPVQWPTHVR